MNDIEMKIFEKGDARDLLEKAQKGDSHAQNEIGEMFLNGVLYQTNPNLPKAMTWLELSHNQGNIAGSVNLGICYQKMEKAGYINDGYKKALKIFSDMHKSGNSYGTYHMGVIYEHGMGVDQNMPNAIQHYKAAVKEENVLALFDWGMMHIEGKKTRQNNATGVEMLEKAALQGHIKSQYNLYVIYEEGDITIRSPRFATKWLKKAVKNGYYPGMITLGDRYYNGCGIRKNFYMASIWYIQAIMYGNKNSILRLKRIIDEVDGIWEKMILSGDLIASYINGECRKFKLECQYGIQKHITHRKKPQYA